MHLVTERQDVTDQAKPLGTHIIAEFFGCTNVSDPEAVEKILAAAAVSAQATVLSSHIHDFGDGMGVTGVVILAESHISIHSWPEHNYAAVDIFTCGHAKPMVAIEYMKSAFLPQTIEIQSIDRGKLQ